MGTFFNVLSEQNITEHFFGVERSVLTEHLDPVFPRTLGQKYPRICPRGLRMAPIRSNFHKSGRFRLKEIGF